MDLHTEAPALSAVQTLHKVSSTPTEAPPSLAPSSLPPLQSGTELFTSVEAVIRRVRELHGVEDPVVAPHRSKYAARIIMVRMRYTHLHTRSFLKPRRPLC
jgi:hypothetical protein